MGFFICAGSFIISVIFYLIFIPILKKFKVKQAVRALGPKSHLGKSGTPTMGGIGFILSPIIILLCFFNYTASIDLLLIIIPFLMLGIVGFFDDYLIIKRHNNDGLSAKTKIILELIISVLFYYLYQYFGYSTLLFIDLKIFYLVLVIFIIIGSANAVNLSDGLDGLCGGLSLIALICFAVIAYISGNTEVMYFSLALIGSIMAFLIYNFHPARIFMGDTGSLAIGGALAAMAIILKVEILLIIIGFVYVVETLSVIIQVLHFKRTKKRVFLMAPLHHHFEMLGLSELQVVLMFWGLGLASGMLGLLIYGGLA